MRVWFDNTLLDSAFHASSHRCHFGFYSQICCLYTLHSPLYTTADDVTLSTAQLLLIDSTSSKKKKKKKTKLKKKSAATTTPSHPRIFSWCWSGKMTQTQSLFIRNSNSVFCRLPKVPELWDKCMIMVVLLFPCTWMTLNFNIKYTHCPWTPLIFIPSLFDPCLRSHVGSLQCSKIVH